MSGFLQSQVTTVLRKLATKLSRAAPSLSLSLSLSYVQLSNPRSVTFEFHLFETFENILGCTAAMYKHIDIFTGSSLPALSNRLDQG